MNWSKAKTILIIFFICTNLFLLLTITMSAGRTSIVTDDIAASTIAILKNNRIYIDSETIPRKTHSIPMMKVKNFVSEYETFAKTFAGENAVLTDNNAYSGSRGTIRFEGDYFEFVAAEGTFSEETKRLSAASAVQVANDIMKKLGFSDSNAVCSVSVDNDKTTAKFTRKKDSLCYFNSDITLVMTSSGLEKIYGTWFLDESALPDKVVMKSVTGVLIDYISLTNRPTVDEKITSLDLGYAILEDGIYHKEAVMTPCWRITLDNGETYVLNAADTKNAE